MNAMFGEVIFEYKLGEEDKQSYFDSFVKRGLIKDSQVVRFSADPTAYNLPELTPAIEVSIRGGESKAVFRRLTVFINQCNFHVFLHAGAAGLHPPAHSGAHTNQYLKMPLFMKAAFRYKPGYHRPHRECVRLPHRKHRKPGTLQDLPAPPPSAICLQESLHR